MSLRVSLPFCFALGSAVGAPGLVAQQPVTRAQAVEAALARGAGAAPGRADPAFAAGALRTARALPNPTLSGTYTKDVPHYHYVADLALDLPWLRSARVGAAASARDAARYGFAFERAAIRFDARSEEHTSELQPPCNLVCRLLLAKQTVLAPSPPLATFTGRRMRHPSLIIVDGGRRTPPVVSPLPLVDSPPSVASTWPSSELPRVH